MDGSMMELELAGLAKKDPGSPVFYRDRIRSALAALAREGVFVGTSSWKYPGWRGQLYTDDRYVWRGRFSEKRFEQLCLAEYSEVFKTVCVDAAYYKFPDEEYLRQLAELVPSDFLFGLKVTDEITIKKFPTLPRFGTKAGRSNPRFLNTDVFASEFLRPCESIRSRVGVILFEFSKFHPADYETGRRFAADLDCFLEGLPGGWPYAVEIRNKNFLHPDYFSTLQKHAVAHVYNSWSEMPPVSEQVALPGSRTSPSLCPARFLLKPGRSYDQAVKLFSPYAKVKEENPNARQAGAAMIRQGRNSEGKKRTFIFVNNRLEGNALHTIAAMLEHASRDES